MPETVCAELNFTLKLLYFTLAPQMPENEYPEEIILCQDLESMVSNTISYSCTFHFVLYLCEQEFIASFWQTDLYYSKLYSHSEIICIQKWRLKRISFAKEEL